MINRILITLAIGALSFAGYQGFTFWNRMRADSMSRVAAHPFQGQAHILYFRSETCTSCATQARLFEQDGAILDHVRKVDADQEPEVAQKYGVMTVPTLMVVDAQGITRRIHYGVVHPRKLKQQLAALR